MTLRRTVYTSGWVSPSLWHVGLWAGFKLVGGVRFGSFAHMSVSACIKQYFVCTFAGISVCSPLAFAGTCAHRCVCAFLTDIFIFALEDSCRFRSLVSNGGPSARGGGVLFLFAKAAQRHVTRTPLSLKGLQRFKDFASLGTLGLTCAEHRQAKIGLYCG